MKRRVITIILSAALMASCLMGCGSDASKPDDDRSFTGRNDDVATDEASEEMSEEATEEATEEASADTSQNGNYESIGNEVYDGFVDGKVKVKYVESTAEYHYGDVFYNYLEDGQEYTIDEIEKNIAGNSIPTPENDAIRQFRYIDCGSDGEKELLVSFEFGASQETMMIIKNVGDELKLCYSGESWDRCDTSIGDNGVITSSGSNGATSHGYDEAYVDKDGVYHFYFEVTDDGDPHNYYVRDEEGNLISLNFSELETEKFMITSYYIVDDNGKSIYYYTYNMLSDNYDIITTDADFAEDNPYMQVFTQNGIKIYRQEEIDEILDKRAKEIGYPG